MNKTFRRGCILALAAVTAASAFMISKKNAEYKRAKEEYKHLNKDFIANVPYGEEKTQKEPEKLYPKLDIDYAALKEINPDFAGILHIPVLDLTYPVVQGEDNTRYLSTTFEGTYNFSGCLFMDCEAKHHMKDPNTFIFGHNMLNGTMFGTLKRFIREPGLCDQNPYMYFYTEDYVYTYRIYSYYLTDYLSSAYDYIEDPESYYEYVAETVVNSSYPAPAPEIDFDKCTPLLTLSTCSGTRHVERFLVHGYLERKEST